MRKIKILICILLFILCFPSCRSNDSGNNRENHSEARPTLLVIPDSNILPSLPIPIIDGSPFDSLPQEIKDLFQKDTWNSLTDQERKDIIANFLMPPTHDPSPTPGTVPIFDKYVQMADLIVIARYEGCTWALDNETEQRYRLENQFVIEQTLFGDKKEKQLTVSDFGIMNAEGIPE